jgi:hypothetical protein
MEFDAINDHICMLLLLSFVLQAIMLSLHLQQFLINLLQFPLTPCHNVALVNTQQENKSIIVNQNEGRARGDNNVGLINTMHNRQPNSSTHK